MATLELMVGSPASHDTGNRSIEMLADILPVGETRLTRKRKSVVVTSGGSLTVDDLPAGIWQIQLTDPTGRRLVRDVVLNETAAQAVTFFDVDLEPRGSREPLAGSGSASNFAVKSPLARTFKTTKRLTIPQASILALSQATEANSLGGWTAIDKLIGQSARSIGKPAKLRGGAIDGEWRLEIEQEIYTSMPRFAVLATSGKISMLQSIPAPWNIFGNDDDLDIQISTRDGRLESNMRISDPGIAGVIAYLGSGSLLNGAKLIHNSPSLNLIEMLRGKVSSPMRACAAAYALVGATDLSQSADWHEWLHNLANWFENIPDGLIILARFEHLTGKKVDVAARVRLALSRGLPHYTLGIAWLRELIMMFPEDKVIQAYRSDVDKAAAYVDVSKPFTCMRWKVTK